MKTGATFKGTNFEYLSLIIVHIIVLYIYICVWIDFVRFYL